MCELKKQDMFTPVGTVARYFYTIHKIRNRQIIKPYVYFIRSENGGPAKNGIADDIPKRIASLQTALPYRLRLIWMIPNGGEEVERSLHHKFAEYHLQGERFEWNYEFERMIRQ